MPALTVRRGAARGQVNTRLMRSRSSRATGTVTGIPGRPLTSPGRQRPGEAYAASILLLAQVPWKRLPVPSGNIGMSRGKCNASNGAEVTCSKRFQTRQKGLPSLALRRGRRHPRWTASARARPSRRHARDPGAPPPAAEAQTWHWLGWRGTPGHPACPDPSQTGARPNPPARETSLPGPAPPSPARAGPWGRSASITPTVESVCGEKPVHWSATGSGSP